MVLYLCVGLLFGRVLVGFVGGLMGLLLFFFFLVFVGFFFSC